MRTEHRLPALGYECWEALHTQATAAGRGEIVALDEERIAATDELLAAGLPALMWVGSRLTAAAITGVDAAPNPRLARQVAAVLRLLDSALVAHGRDNGYDVAAWRSSAVTAAWAWGDTDGQADTTSLAEVVEDVLEHVARVFVALSRDRLGVPESLADAIGQMLVVYASAKQRSL